MTGRYFDEAFSKAMLLSIPSFVRTIPVQESLDAKHTVATFEDAEHILNSQKVISVADFICRKKNHYWRGLQQTHRGMLHVRLHGEILH